MNAVAENAIDPHQPLAFAVSPFGEMTLDVSRAKFLLWLEQQFKRGVPPIDFMKALVTELVVFQSKPDSEGTAEITPAQLNEIAAAIRVAAGTFFDVALDHDDASYGHELRFDATANQPAAVSEVEQLHETLRLWLDSFTSQLRHVFAHWDKVMPKPVLDSNLFAKLPSWRMKEAFPALEAVRATSNLAAGLAGMDLYKSPALRGIWSKPEFFNLPAFAALHRVQAVTEGLVPIVQRWSAIRPELTKLTRAWYSPLSVSVFQKQFGLQLADLSFLKFSTEDLDRVTRWARLEAQMSDVEPAFRNTAELALEGGVPFGVAADVLKNFDRRSAGETAHFDSTVAAAQSFGSPVDLAAWCERIEGLIERQPLASGKVRSWSVEHVNLILAIVTFIITALTTYNDLTDRSEAYLEKIVEQNQRLLEQHQEAMAYAQSNAHVRYVHIRTPLRESPNGTRLRYIFPDQTLRLIGERGEWVEVEVFSYETEDVLRGWVSRRNLRRSPL